MIARLVELVKFFEFCCCKILIDGYITPNRVDCTYSRSRRGGCCSNGTFATPPPLISIIEGYIALGMTGEFTGSLLLVHVEVDAERRLLTETIRVCRDEIAGRIFRMHVSPLRRSRTKCHVVNREIYRTRAHDTRKPAIITVANEKLRTARRNAISVINRRIWKSRAILRPFRVQTFHAMINGFRMMQTILGRPRLYQWSPKFNRSPPGGNTN